MARKSNCPSAKKYTLFPGDVFNQQSAHLRKHAFSVSLYAASDTFPYFVSFNATYHCQITHHIIFKEDLVLDKYDFLSLHRYNILVGGASFPTLVNITESKKVLMIAAVASAS
jgi:hypothetical protein